MTPTDAPAAAAPELEGLVCSDRYAASRAVTAAYRPILGEWGLADTPALDHGTLTPLLRRMQAAGLLVRSGDPRDERSVRVAIADGGCAR